jgi:predicted lipid-binding transport protein (Tim44 family)
VLFGLQRASFARLGLALALFALAGVLLVAALVQLVDALYVALLMLTGQPALASLITGLVLLALAGLSVAVARRYLRRRLTLPQAAAAGAGAELTAQIVTLIRRNPRQAALIATVVGFVVGSLPDLRRAISEVLDVGKPKRRAEPPPQRPTEP